MAAERSVTNQAVVAATIDVAAIIAFVLVGRASHNEGLVGALDTLWPFIVGLAVGWAGLRAWRSPRRIVWTGLGIWFSTVVLGMLLRVASGQGVAITFVIVASLVLAVLLLGWRGLASLVAWRTTQHNP